MWGALVASLAIGWLQTFAASYNVRMGDLIHTSKIRIHQDQPPERRAYIEGFEEPLEFGVHGGIKHFYGMEPERDLPATLDHMVAAVGG